MKLNENKKEKEQHSYTKNNATEVAANIKLGEKKSYKWENEEIQNNNNTPLNGTQLVYVF